MTELFRRIVWWGTPLNFEVVTLEYYNYIIYLTVYPSPNKPLFLYVKRTISLKTLWEKEKLPETSNFSFSHSIFNVFGKLFTIFIEFKNLILQTLLPIPTQ